MSNDTLSRDPKRQSEALRAQAEQSLPKPSYSPKGVALEIYEKRILKDFDTKGFELVWTAVTVPFLATPKLDDILTILTEEEFRQACDAIFRGVNALNLQVAAAKESTSSRAEQISVLNKIDERVGKNPKLSTSFPDILHGFMRANVNLAASICLDHPNGCPPVSGSFEQSDIQAMVDEILNKKSY